MDANIIIGGLNVVMLGATLFYLARQTVAQQSQVQVQKLQIESLERQIGEARNGTWAATFVEMAKWLQDEKVRDARRAVFKLDKAGKAFESWSADERAAVEMTASTYNIAGIVARWNMLPPQIILDSWSGSLRGLWPICRPYIEERRNRESFPLLWAHFEWLSQEAQKQDHSQSI